MTKYATDRAGAGAKGVIAKYALRLPGFRLIGINPER